MNEWTSVPWIVGTSAVLSNGILYFFGGELTPKQKVGLGAMCGILVYFFVMVMYPQDVAFSTPQDALRLLMQVLITILTSAGVPVVYDGMKGGTPMREEALPAVAAAPFALSTIEEAARSGEYLPTPTPKRARRFVPWNVRQ